MAPRTASRDVAGMVLAAVFILLGAVLWWDTTTMSDPDSYVFPRATIVAMVVFCLILIVSNLMRIGGFGGASGDAAAGGSTPRRIGLVAAMLAGTLMMPVFGFVVSGLAVFGVLTLVAMYDPWTRFRLIVYPLAGTAIVVGFYLLFSELLLVPLPVGSVFE